MWNWTRRKEEPAKDVVPVVTELVCGFMVVSVWIMCTVGEDFDCRAEVFEFYFFD
jgi:hypothetical protein